jgi:tight adherence protein B
MIPVVTFALVFIGCSGAYWFFVVRPEQHAERALSRRLTPRARAAAAATGRLLKDVQALSSVAGFDSALARTRGLSTSLQALIDQSGSKTTVAKLLLICGCVALAVFVGVMLLIGMPLAAVPAAAAAAFAPIGFLRFKRTRRLRRFEEQFPEALDLLARALRAGHSFSTAIEMVAEEMPAPIGPEFKLLYDQQNYGLAMPDAMRLFAERIPILDSRFFVTAVLIQRESGGNLSEVLDNLAKVMRDRFRVKRQMRVISAHGRITGWVLVALPPVLGAVLMTINDDHRATMFGDPLGHQMMFAGAALQVIGTLIIRKIVNVEY